MKAEVKKRGSLVYTFHPALKDLENAKPLFRLTTCSIYWCHWWNFFQWILLFCKSCKSRASSLVRVEDIPWPGGVRLAHQAHWQGKVTINSLVVYQTDSRLTNPKSKSKVIVNFHSWVLNIIGLSKYQVSLKAVKVSKHQDRAINPKQNVLLYVRRFKKNFRKMTPNFSKRKKMP